MARSDWRDWLEYFAVRTMGWVVEALPVEWALPLVRGLSRLACRLDRRHREVALDNLRHAFPGRYTEEQLHELVQQVYEHFGQFLMELPLAYRKLHRHNWQRYVPINHLHHFFETRRQGRPAILATAHFGSWEVFAQLIALGGVKMDIVTRPLDNPHLEKLARKFRTRHGHGLLSKHGDLDGMRRVLAAGDVVCTVVDQDAGPRGLFVNFFGRPASAHRSVAYLARRYNARIMVFMGYRTDTPLHCALEVVDVIDPQDYAGMPDANLLITQRLTDGIEHAIRKNPRQYLWLHRRWKHSHLAGHASPPTTPRTTAA